MKNLKKGKMGVLTVEASIVLPLAMMFILFLLSFARVYRAQNVMSHAALQSVDAVAMESYLRETALRSDAEQIAGLASKISAADSISADSLESLRSADVPTVARQKFIAAVADTEDEADKKLKSLGVKDGLNGIDFSASTIDLSNDDVVVCVKYSIEMQFKFFGYNEIEATKSAKAKTFGEVLFDVTTECDPPQAGVAKGDCKVVHGSSVEISAEAKHGYEFIGWDDNNDGNVDSTENPREVTVSAPAHYVAKFKKVSYGVNLETKLNYDTKYNAIVHYDYGTVSGDGVYQFEEIVTIEATPGENYDFVGWETDDPTLKIENKTSAKTRIKVTDICHLTAVFKPKSVKITVKANYDSYGFAAATQKDIVGSDSDPNYLIVEYGSRVELDAFARGSDYRFKQWNDHDTRSSHSVVIMTTDDIEYIAEFELNTWTVTFYLDSTCRTKLGSTKVTRGSSIKGSQSIGAKMQPTPSSNSNYPNTGFYYWKQSNGETFTEEKKVNNNIDVYAVWAYTVTFNINIESDSKFDGNSWNIPSGDVVARNKTYAKVKREVNLEIGMPKPTLTISGHPITSWNTKPDGTGQTYDLNKTYSFTADTTLYAQWDHSNNLSLQSGEKGKYYCYEVYDEGSIREDAKKVKCDFNCGAKDIERIPLPSELKHRVKVPEVKNGIWVDVGNSDDDFNTRCTGTNDTYTAIVDGKDWEGKERIRTECEDDVKVDYIETNGHLFPDSTNLYWGDKGDNKVGYLKWFSCFHVICDHCYEVEQPENRREKANGSYGYKKTYFQGYVDYGVNSDNGLVFKEKPTLFATGGRMGTGFLQKKGCEKTCNRNLLDVSNAWKGWKK